MKTRVYSLLYVLLAYLPSVAQICWYEPATATVDDEITVYFDASLSYGALGTVESNLAGYEGDVYAHTGVITTESSGTFDWKHASIWDVNDPKYLMTRSADNPDLYTLTMVPSEFYDLDEGERVAAFAFVFRSADGNYSGRDEGGYDLIVDLQSSDAVIGEDVNPGGGETGGDEWNPENPPVQPDDPAQAGAYVSHGFENGVLKVECENADLYITPYNDYVVKVLSVPSGKTPDMRESIAVVATPEVSAKIEDGTSALVLYTGGLSVRINKTDGTIAFHDLEDKLVLKEFGGMDNAGSNKTCTFEPMGDKGFYGGGYNGQTINLDNRRIIIDNTQTGGWSSFVSPPHNICIPFVVSTSGYGLFFDDLYRYSSLTPSSDKGTSYSSGSLNDVAYFFIGGGSMSEVLKNFTWLTGRQELPPYWALGYITSRYGYHSAAEAEQVIGNFKNTAFPIDGLVFDLYWQGADESGMGNLDWYGPNFPDPEGMMAEFAADTVHTICITEPFFTSSSSNYEILNAAGYLADADVPNMGWLHSSRVGLIDASNPEAMDWMWQFYKARTQEGVSGWWLDLGEPEQHGYNSVHKGGSIDQVHNEFGNLWVERVYRGLKEDFPDMRPFIMPRAGASGMQRLSVFPWTGDISRSWSGLQAQIPALISSGMSGVAYMGSDVGGFTSMGTYPELYLRWVQFAVFSPMMRTHSADQPEPYLPCYSSVFEDVRDFMNLRYRYLPYTYTLCYENAVEGTPLARPSNFHDVEGGNANSIDTYLWGKDIFVAPVVSGGTSRNITFPEGEWVDLNDYSAVYTGGSTVNYEAPLQVLPYFGRKGSFITRYGQTTFTNTVQADNANWNILYLMPDDGSKVSSYVFDDDKISPQSLESGNYSIICFNGQTISGNDYIEISNEGYGYENMPEERTYVLEIPSSVNDFAHISFVSGGMEQVIPAAADESSFSTSNGNAYYLDDKGVLKIKVTCNNLPGSANTISIIRNILPAPVEENRAGQKGFACVPQPVGETLGFVYELESGEIAYSVSIYDMRGLMIAGFDDIAANEGSNKFAVLRPAAMSPGIYVACLTTNYGVRSCKIVVR